MEVLVHKLQPYLLWLRAYINSMTNAQLLRFIFWIVVAVMCIWIIDKNSRKRKKKKKTTKVKYKTAPNIQYGNTNTATAKNYQKKQFMTTEEIRAYEQLKQFASYNFMHVFPKVKLLTFMELQNGPNYPYLLEKLSDKYVDFVVLDQSMKVKTIIELDGCNPEWRGPDTLKDQVLREIGCKVIHTKYITQEILREI